MVWQTMFPTSDDNPTMQTALMISQLTRAIFSFFFFQAEDGIRDYKVTGVQTCALPIYRATRAAQGPVGALGLDAARVLRVRGPRYRALQASRGAHARAAGAPAARHARSEERRVGKEGRSRWSPDH